VAATSLFRSSRITTVIESNFTLDLLIPCKKFLAKYSLHYHRDGAKILFRVCLKRREMTELIDFVLNVATISFSMYKIKGFVKKLSSIL
jgi:hypothetical protein